jgi:hypothetical protein
VTGRPAPVFVVGTADAGLENDPAGPFTAVSIRPPVEQADFRDDAMLTTAANNALALNVTVPEPASH